MNEGLVLRVLGEKQQGPSELFDKGVIPLFFRAGYYYFYQ